ncbi:MAG TPA: hypothetical protein VGB45_16415 [Abditibacterium sp.]|jgi:hypothetical protein
MKESPSFALKMATSLGFLLILWPFVWRFGVNPFVLLFGVPSIGATWGYIYSRDPKKSRVEQDWELFNWSFFTIACGLTVLALTEFPPIGEIAFIPLKWIVPASLLVATVCFLIFKFDLAMVGRGEKILIYVLLPPFMFVPAIGVLAYFNGALDFREPLIHAVSIRGKRMERGKYSRGPLLEVAHWHDAGKNEEVRVLYGDYDEAEVGKLALVRVKPGLLGGEWVEAAGLQ